MPGRRAVAASTALIPVLLLWCLPHAGARSFPKDPPVDFVGGGELPTGGRTPAARKANALGTTGAFFWLWLPEDSLARDIPYKQVCVVSVAEDTPAHGVLRAGDIIVGIGGKSFDKDLRQEMAAALAAAERPENEGRLALTVWRDGTTHELAITIPVVQGRYDPAAPLSSGKIQTRIDQLTAAILKRELKGGISDCLCGLGLLATGEKVHLPKVKALAQALLPDNKPIDINQQNINCWYGAYRLILLSEYYLATQDKAALPGIRTLAIAYAQGQSGAGTWGHRLTRPIETNGAFHGPPPGYGAMNAVSITMTIALRLAQQCGVDHPEVRQAVQRSHDFLRFFVDRGTIPYGDHEPHQDKHENNGKNSQVAVLFDLLGNREASAYFARMTLASAHGTVREQGHTGHFFSQVWGPLGAGVAGPNAADVFLDRMHYYYQLEQRLDGRCVYQPNLHSDEEHLKYRNWDLSGARLLQYCLPRKAIYLTGKNGRTMDPLSREEAKAAVAEGERDTFAELTTEQLLTSLGSWSPIRRKWAAAELSRRDEDLVGALIDMLDSENRYARYGACDALRRAGRQSTEAVDALIKVLQTSKDLTFKWHAVWALCEPDDANGHGLKTVAFTAVPTLLELAATVDEEQDPRRKLHFTLSLVLFYSRNHLGFEGLLGHGKGFDKVDAKKLRAAVRSILSNPNGRARSLCSDTFSALSEADRQALWADIYTASKERSPSGVMYQDIVRINGVKLMADHAYKEGLDVGMLIYREKRWGAFRRKRGIPEAFVPYGVAAKPYVPEFRKAAEKGKPEDPKTRRLLEIIEILETAPAPELKSLTPYLKAP